MSRKAQEEAKKENHERWIVSYADMITLLLAAFVVLYAMSNPDVTRLERVRQSIEEAFSPNVLRGSFGASPIFEGGAGGAIPTLSEIRSQDLARLTEQLGEAARRLGAVSGIQIRSDEESITVSLADNLLFDSGSADLRPGSQAVLSAVAAVLREMPNQLRIEGHTDNVPVNNPEYPTNWELSAARATAVARYLIEQEGIPPERISIAGFADSRPIADNSTPEGRALNRRADIVILYPSAADLQRALGRNATPTPTPVSGEGHR